ncbi:hypothetical protein HN873_063783, partial [Arachis hypogaea]
VRSNKGDPVCFFCSSISAGGLLPLFVFSAYASIFLASIATGSLMLCSPILFLIVMFCEADLTLLVAIAEQDVNFLY